MKRIILMLALFGVVIGAKAQVAIEDGKLFDNTHVTIQGGVATPLKLSSVFPVNPTATLSIGKWFTPVFGAEVEGTAWFGSVGMKDGNLSWDWDGNMYNFVRGSYVGINGLTNLTNLFCGYNGKPRTFEVGTQIGIGWVHRYMKTNAAQTIEDNNIPFQVYPNADKDRNGVGVKTGLDFAFNLGSKKAHTLSVRPAVLWEVANHWNKVQFNRNKAQLYLGVAYTYHFKNSNGTHYFKTHDIGELNAQINYLRGRLDECEGREPKVVERIVEKTVDVVSQNTWVVQFAKNSYELTNEAKEVLDAIGENTVVNIVGTASPEGEMEHNKRLSEQRAANVADYLSKRGVKVNSWVGKGVMIGESTNRLAIVTVNK